MKIGRNDPCYCGSGKKYKKCCGLKENLHSSLNLDTMNYKPEPFLNIVPSLVWKGYRHRAIWNRIYHRPIQETFHEFIHNVLLWTFGKDWHSEQINTPQEKRHIVGKWLFSLAEWQKCIIKDENKVVINGYSVWGAPASGEVLALIQLEYDIFCLQIVNKLPNFLTKRLKNNREYQGARYEVAVAAIMARAGFEIVFLDDKVKQEKHCEFIAKNIYSSIELGVEAKSRRRKGVLNEEGELLASFEQRGDVWHLFNKARTQKPKDIPFIIFIDINLPLTPNVPFGQKVWINDVIKMINDYGEATPNNPDPYNAVIFTNYAYYYSGISSAVPSGEYSVCTTKYPETPLQNNEIISIIVESVNRYGLIPDEI